MSKSSTRGSGEQDAASSPEGGEGASSACLLPDENQEREDWTLFRTIEGLAQRAGSATGVAAAAGPEGAGRQRPRYRQRDRSQAHRRGPQQLLFFVADKGPGLDGTPEEIAELYSIRRPMRSSKLIRLPQRGALGNGLRVVAGAVLASQGWLTVITHNRRIELAPPGRWLDQSR